MWQQIFGLLLVVVGPFMVIKVDAFQRMIGKIDWAEDKLGPGGTRFFLQILGIVFIFVGLLMIFGLFNGILEFIFGPLMPKQSV